MPSRVGRPHVIDEIQSFSMSFACFFLRLSSVREPSCQLDIESYSGRLPLVYGSFFFLCSTAVYSPQLADL